MALSKAKARLTGMPESDVKVVVAQFNNLLNELLVWATRLDGETLADSDYVARLEAAVSLVADTDNVEV